MAMQWFKYYLTQEKGERSVRERKKRRMNEKCKWRKRKK
jgi:hypothetical protein